MLVRSYKIITLWLVCALAFMAGGVSPAQAQIVINEVMASNQTTIADEDGDYEDWIEILNISGEPVNLEDMDCRMITSARFAGNFRTLRSIPVSIC